jgi:hypothetical protein
MQTGSIGSTGGVDPLKRYTAQKRPVAKKEGDPAPAKSMPKDSVTLSEAVKGSRLDQVREKLKQGFYDSESVRDAVSDKLSTVFEEETE